MDGFIRDIREIHKALIRHRDAKPRNMMIVKDDPSNRVIWLDSDRAGTYDEECITEKEKRLIEEELIVTELRDVLVCITMLWPAVSSFVYVRLTACSGRKLICRKESWMRHFFSIVLDSQRPLFIDDESNAVLLLSIQLNYKDALDFP